MSERSLVLIGPGEVGRRLAGALESGGWRASVVTRTSGWDRALDESDPSPRLVAVREEDLGAVLDRFEGPLRQRLVLVQNGFLEVVHGDLSDVSRGLIWFMSKKDVFHELWPSLFYGPCAGGIAEGLVESGTRVEVIEDRKRALTEMVLKGVWNCVVGLPLAIAQVDLATYKTMHSVELRALVDEAARAASAEYGVEVGAGEALERIHATTGPIGWVKGGTKALRWRNGAVSRLGRRHGIETPVNDRLLAAAGFEP